MKKIAIIGSGSFGCAVANHLANKGNQVKIWSFKEEEATIINNEKRCIFLENSKLNENIKCYTSYDKVIKDTEYIILVTPSKFIRETCKNIKNYVTDQKIIIASKGLEEETNKLLSETVNEELPNNLVGVLSGPSHAEEVIKGMPTNIEFVSNNNSYNDEIKQLFSSNNFSIEISDDIVGVQIGGSLKNIIALASGILSGLNYSKNVEAALITKGLNEIKKIGLKMNAKEETFYGLSGLGDLIVTCSSDNSRNRRAGIQLAQNKSLNDIKNEIGMVIEGLDNLKVAKELIEKYNISCPIIEATYSIIYEGKEASSILNSILR